MQRIYTVIDDVVTMHENLICTVLQSPNNLLKMLDGSRQVMIYNIVLGSNAYLN